MSVDDVTEILAVELLGVIPDDEQVVIATNQGEPVVGDGSQAGAAYERICRRLAGEEIPICDFSRPEGILGRFSVCRRRQRAAEKSSCVRQDQVRSGRRGQAFKRPLLYCFKIYGDYTGRF